ncbi:hypothetical protein FOA52_015876 [Chlamydomonas sp. UWO 241]|nr:hypothetical protein FOA52_015876 [Chlamydomonas sp. UWO 241]
MGGVADDIRPCPYEPSSYFVREPDGQESTWAVGSRYRLVKVLGQGGFSCVVLAEDTTTGEQVALKRVGDVLYSTENAKRVLREVCIMRRMCHPNVVQLKDVFVRPSQTGRCFFRNGQLVNASLDLYMAMEYMNGGDLFSMRGQMHENEVHSILWQLLSAVQYLHNNNVWHRDLKSANVLVAFEAGCRVVKVADFGSARSAEADTSTASPPPSPAALPAGAAAAAAAGAAAAAAAAAENAGVAAGPVGGGTRSAPASLAQSRRVTSDGAPAASTGPRGDANGFNP